MLRVTQVGGACRHRMQDTAHAFFAQVLRVTDLLRHPFHQPRGLVRIELIGHKDPSRLRVQGDGLRDVLDKIHFRARVADARRELPPRGHFVVGNQTLGTVAQVLIFLARTPCSLARHARLHGVRWRHSFQCLDAGLFIGADEVGALRMQLWRGSVEVTNGFDLRLELRRVALRGIEPGFSVVQINIQLILKNARHWSGKYAGQCRV